MKAAKQTNKSKFADLLADSELEQSTINIGDHSVIIRELTGRERFELGERPMDQRWDTLLWCAYTGLVDPKPETIEEMDGLKTDWVITISNAVLALSGLEADAEDAAENELAVGIGIGGS